MKKASIFMIATLLAAIVLMGFTTGAQGLDVIDSTNDLNSKILTTPNTNVPTITEINTEKKTNDAREASGKTVDIAVTDITILPEDPKVGDTIHVFVQIENYGKEPVEAHIGYEVTFPDGSGFGTGFCCITVYPEKDPYTYTFTFEASQVGNYNIDFSAWPENSEDKNPSNNQLSLNFYVRDIILLIGDFDGNEIIGVADLLALLGNWGTDNALYDEDGSGIVDKADLQMLLANWGEGKMLRGDIVHSGVLSHCSITSEELTIVLANIGGPMDNPLSRLADLDNDGLVTEKDVELMIIQTDLSQALGYGSSYREDLNCNTVMDNGDVELLTELWGPKDYNDTWADINGDGTVGVLDLLELLASPGWN